MGVSFIREMIKATKGIDGMISLAGGLPSPDSFPRDDLAALFKEVIEKEGADVLQYGPSEGDDFLKEQIFRFEKETSPSRKVADHRRCDQRITSSPGRSSIRAMSSSARAPFFNGRSWP
jgi:hypothetical protein